MGGDPDATFAEFLRFAQQKPNHHWLPQSLYVPKNLSFLGALENFTEDFERVQRVAIEAGLVESAFTPPNLNSTRSRHYSDYFSDVERKLVEEMYRVDIDRFGYTF